MGQATRTSAAVLSGLLLLCCSNIAMATVIHPSQVTILQACQKAWGKTFAGWTTGANCATADRITCDAAGYVKSMMMGGLALTGSLPDSLFMLDKLTILDMTYNSLTGGIPINVGMASKLQEL
ncbi:unnamed protein product [Closterium sp. NIES-54]